MLVHKGRALTRLGQCEEALKVFGTAESKCPEVKFETIVLIDRSNCLKALGRFEDAYRAGELVVGRGDTDIATLAMQYMAECRIAQGRAQEALAICRDLLRRLPCPLVPGEQVQAGIENCVTRLEKLQPKGKPS